MVGASSLLAIHKHPRFSVLGEAGVFALEEPVGQGEVNDGSDGGGNGDNGNGVVGALAGVAGLFDFIQGYPFGKGFDFSDGLGVEALFVLLYTVGVVEGHDNKCGIEDKTDGV